MVHICSLYPLFSPYHSNDIALAEVRNNHLTATYNKFLGPLCSVDHSHSYTLLSWHWKLHIPLVFFLQVWIFLQFPPNGSSYMNSLKPVFPKISFWGNCSSHSTYSAWVALSTLLMSTASYKLKKSNMSPALPLPYFQTDVSDWQLYTRSQSHSDSRCPRESQCQHVQNYFLIL